MVSLNEYLWMGARAEAVVLNKMNKAAVSDDFSKITQADKDIFLTTMTSIANLWKNIMVFSYMYLTFPILILNKYVFCKLTQRPFVWLMTYTSDLMAMSCYLYQFGWHIVWLYEQNEGFGIEAVPS